MGYPISRRGATWGQITGNLNDQTDLRAELDRIESLIGEPVVGDLVASGFDDEFWESANASINWTQYAAYMTFNVGSEWWEFTQPTFDTYENTAALAAVDDWTQDFTSATHARIRLNSGTLGGGGSRTGTVTLSDNDGDFFNTVGYVEWSFDDDDEEKWFVMPLDFSESEPTAFIKYIVLNSDQQSIAPYITGFELWDGPPPQD